MVHRHRTGLQGADNLLRTSTANGVLFSAATTFVSFATLSVSTHLGVAHRVDRYHHRFGQAEMGELAMNESNGADAEREGDGLSDPARLYRPALRALAAIACALALAAAVLPFQTRDPYVDGVYYVAQLHAFYVDGDVDMTPEAEHSPWLLWYTHQVGPAPGGLRTPFPVGPPLFWAPFYALHDFWSRATGGEGVSREAGPIVAPIYFATTFWVVIALWLLADLLRHTGASALERAGIAGLIFALSPLPAYVFFAPDMSHGTSFAASTIMLWMSIHCRNHASPSSAMWMLAGISWGLVFCARLQDAMLFTLPLVLLLAPRGDERALDSLKRCIPGLAWLAAGALIGAFPQLAHWKALYGGWISFPMGGDFFSWSHFHPLAFLFSTWNGLFLSHPALLVCLAGFFIRPPGHTPGPWLGMRALQIVALLTLTIELASCTLMVDWWAGGSFGQRRVISLLPLFALALQALISWVRSQEVPAWRHALATGAALFLALNVLSLTRLFDGSLPYNPSDTNWYPSGPAYGHYEYDRYLSDLFFGAEP